MGGVAPDAWPRADFELRIPSLEMRPFAVRTDRRSLALPAPVRVTEGSRDEVLRSGAQYTAGSGQGIDKLYRSQQDGQEMEFMSPLQK